MKIRAAGESRCDELSENRGSPGMKIEAGMKIRAAGILGSSDQAQRGNPLARGTDLGNPQAIWKPRVPQHKNRGENKIKGFSIFRIRPAGKSEYAASILTGGLYGIL